MTLKSNERYKLKVIQVYNPKSNYSDEKFEKFYEDIGSMMNRGPAHYNVMMLLLCYVRQNDGSLGY